MNLEPTIASSPPQTLRALRAGSADSGQAARGRAEEVARVQWLRMVLGPYGQHPKRWEARQVFFATMTLVALLYLALYHPHWVRGGDSELYLAIARNLARGEGYRYNGQPVGLVPPGWPLLLAAGMWFTSNIALLKLLLVGSIFIFLASAFHVLRRYVSAWLSAAVTLVVAILQPTWQLSTWFYSDGPFLAASWLALLLALQAREIWLQAERSSRLWWRIAAVLALLAASTSIRWTGILWCPIVALALLDGRQPAQWGGWGEVRVRLWPRRVDVMWIAAGLCVLVAFLSFFGLRSLLRVDPSELDPRYGAFESSGYELINTSGDPTIATHLGRFLAGPQWLSIAWWHLAARTRPFTEVAFWIAALTVIPLACAGLVGLARRQWLWLGAAIAWVPIIVTWPNAIDRYTLPVAPLLVLGTILGTVWLYRRLDEPIRGRRAYVLARCFLAAVFWGTFGLIAGYGWKALYNTAPRVIERAVMQTPLLQIPAERAGPALLAILLLILFGLVMFLSVRAWDQRAGSGADPQRLPWLLRITPVWLVLPAALLMVLHNVAAFGAGVWVARDPVNRYEAGLTRSLVSIGHFLRLNDETVFPGELAVAQVRDLNEKRYATLGPRRKTIWLADRNAIDVPFELAHVPGQPPGIYNARPPLAPTNFPGDELSWRLVEWLRQRNVRWYVIMPAQRRFLHLPRAPWEPADPAFADSAWRLYEITPHFVGRVEVREQRDDVLIVPGLEDVRDVAGGRSWLPIPYN